MNKYNIRISETICYDIEVEADNIELAKEFACDNYQDGEITANVIAIEHAEEIVDEQD